jgi:hypothetical protein
MIIAKSNQLKCRLFWDCRSTSQIKRKKSLRRLLGPFDLCKIKPINTCNDAGRIGCWPMFFSKKTQPRGPYARLNLNFVYRLTLASFFISSHIQNVHWPTNIVVLCPFQIVSRFSFSMYIVFAMHLDIRYVQYIVKSMNLEKSKRLTIWLHR